MEPVGPFSRAFQGRCRINPGMDHFCLFILTWICAFPGPSLGLSSKPEKQIGACFSELPSVVIPCQRNFKKATSCVPQLPSGETGPWPKKEQLDSQLGSTEEPNSLGGARQVFGIYLPLLSSQPWPLPHDLFSWIAYLELGRCRGKEQSQAKESSGGSSGTWLGRGCGCESGWSSRVFANSGEQRRGALFLGLVSFCRKSPDQCSLPAPLPCCISWSLSHLMSLLLLDPGVGDEQVLQARLYSSSFCCLHSLLTFHSQRWLHRPSAERLCQPVSPEKPFTRYKGNLQRGFSLSLFLNLAAI